VVTGQHVATLPAPGGLCQADGSISSTPTGTRTPVPWLRTKYPRPLDDGGIVSRFIINHTSGESSLRSILNRPHLPVCSDNQDHDEIGRRTITACGWAWVIGTC